MQDAHANIVSVTQRQDTSFVLRRLLAVWDLLLRWVRHWYVLHVCPILSCKDVFQFRLDSAYNLFQLILCSPEPPRFDCAAEVLRQWECKRDDLVDETVFVVGLVILIAVQVAS